MKENNFEFANNSVPIIDLISKYIDLQKNGQDYIGICPFHDDTNPSLSVSPKKNIWKCFVCGAGTTPIDFLVKYKNINSYQALILLNEDFKLGLKLSSEQFVREQTPEEKQNHSFIKINEMVKRYYQTVLNSKQGISAKDYLQKRKISADSIKKFEIGYAAGKSSLYDYLNANHIALDEIDNTKLFNANNQDYYFNRLIFPIKDADDHTVGFSGRTIKKDEPKYLVSRETPVFHKSQIVWNFNNVKTILNNVDNLIITEGFMDVISLDQAGYKNTVALLGTNLSEQQAQILKVTGKQLLLFLDGDKPGIKATIKLAEQLLDHDVEFKIVHNTTNMDPDELSHSDPNELKNMIENPISLIEWLVDVTNLRRNMNTSILDWVLNIINHASSPLKKELLITELSKTSKLSLESLIQELTSINDSKNLASNWAKKNKHLLKNLYYKPLINSTDKQWYCYKCHKEINKNVTAFLFDNKIFDSQTCLLAYFYDQFH